MKGIDEQNKIKKEKFILNTEEKNKNYKEQKVQ